MKSIADLFDELGGATAIAAELGIPYTTVASWKLRPNGIPIRHWSGLIAMAKRKRVSGVHDAALVRLHLELAAS